MQYFFSNIYINEDFVKTLRVFPCFIDLTLQAQGKQLRSYWVGQLLNHTVPRASFPEGVYHYKVPIMSPITENYRFYSLEKLRYITNACYLNVNISGCVSMINL